MNENLKAPEWVTGRPSGSMVENGVKTSRRPRSAKKAGGFEGDDEEQNSIVFQVQGAPHPQPRPRASGSHVVSVTDKKVRLWIGAVERAASEARRAVGGEKGIKAILGERDALRFAVLFEIGTDTAERWGEWHAYTPDADNLAKLAMDAVFSKRGLVRFGNDGRVAWLDVKKKWCNPKDSGCTIIIDSVDLII